MKLKTLFKWSSFIISALGIVIFSIIMLYIGLPPSSQSSYVKPILPITGQTLFQKTSLPDWQTNLTTEQVNPGLPIRLRISKINVDAPVVPVGLTPGGAMDVTKGPYDVAWFKPGPRPGQKGSAVIAGHFGVWKNGAISVFHNLNKLAKGDIISVEDDNGATISFVVRESKIYDPKADASAVFYSSDGKSHLNFVTCVWDKVSKTYSKRLVVFTDKI